MSAFAWKSISDFKGLACGEVKVNEYAQAFDNATLLESSLAPPKKLET